jgi:prophage maintenance system killer protein
VIVWLERDVLLALHDAVLATTGGQAGIADYLGLELLRLRQLPPGRTEDGALPALAAAQTCALIERPPFRSGNLATAAAAMETFLALNGLELAVPEEDIAVAVRAVADGEWGAPDLSEWLGRSVRPIC